MRPSRVFRWIVRIFILILTLSVTAVSLLGGMSAVLILSNPQNIEFDTDNIEFNFDANWTIPIEINNINFTLPFNFTNAGFYDLEDLKLNFQIGLLYSHVNLTGDGLNKTNFVKIYDNSTSFPTIKKGKTYYGNYTGTTSDFGNFLENFPEYDEIDFTRDPDFELYGNFTLSLTYSLGLHSLRLGIYNISIYEFSVL